MCKTYDCVCSSKSPFNFTLPFPGYIDRVVRNERTYLDTG